MKAWLNLILAAAVLFPIGAFAADLDRGRGPDIIDASMQSPLDGEVQRRRNIELFLAPVKSERDLSEHLATKLGRGSPLDQLSTHARERFLGSLTFNPVGLTGFRYDDLEAELSVTQAYQVLSLFGAQDTLSKLRLRQATDQDVTLIGLYAAGAPQVPNDHYNYECVGRATCKWGINYICMSACLVVP